MFRISEPRTRGRTFAVVVRECQRVMLLTEMEKIIKEQH